MSTLSAIDSNAPVIAATAAMSVVSSIFVVQGCRIVFKDSDEQFQGKKKLVACRTVNWSLVYLSHMAAVFAYQKCFNGVTPTLGSLVGRAALLTSTGYMLYSLLIKIFPTIRNTNSSTIKTFFFLNLTLFLSAIYGVPVLLHRMTALGAEMMAEFNEPSNAPLLM